MIRILLFRGLDFQGVMVEFTSCDRKNIPTLQAVATVGWMVGKLFGYPFSLWIIGRMGDINSSSSRFSVFIIPDQHYHQGEYPMSMWGAYFFEMDFRWFHQPLRFHSGCSPLVIEDGISQCCKNGLTDGQLRCCIPTVLLAFWNLSKSDVGEVCSWNF